MNEFRFKRTDETDYTLLSLVAGQDEAEAYPARNRWRKSAPVPSYGTCPPLHPPELPPQPEHVSIKVNSIDLSEGMAASASAVAYSMGEYGSLTSKFRLLQSFAGLGLGSWFPSFYAFKSEESCCNRFLAFFLSVLLHLSFAVFVVQGTP